MKFEKRRKTSTSILEGQKEILEVEKKMAKDNSGIVKSIEGLQNDLKFLKEQMDRDRLEFGDALKNGERQSKTWVDMALGNNLVINEKMKQIQETTQVMIKQNEVREKEENFNNLVFRGIKEEKEEDLVLKVLEVLKSDIAEGRTQNKEIVLARRVRKKDMFPRLVVVQDLDKNVRESTWVKRYNLGERVKFLLRWTFHSNKDFNSDRRFQK